MRIFSEIWRELNTPDGFTTNWYGYATNQVTHLAMGFSAVCVVSALYFGFHGEFSQKAHLWGLVAISYAIYEMAAQGWNGKDTVEDWVFFSLYGAGVPVVIMNEVTPGNPTLEVNSQLVVPAIGLVVAHLLGGIIARVYLKIRGQND
jgi:hypothetical protein